MSMTQKQEIVVAASCADTQVWAWDITTGALVSTYRGPGNVYSGLCKVGNKHFATSQLQLSSASFGVVQYFEWHKPTPALKCFTEEPLTTLASTPSGNHIIGGSGSGRLFVWEVATGELLGTWIGHYKRVSALLTLEDGSIIVSGSDDGLVNVWSLISALDPGQGHAGRQGIAPLYSWAHHSLPITSLHAGFSSNGCNIVSASLDHTIKVWSTSMGRLLLSVEFPTALHSVLLDPSEVSIFAGGADGRIFRSKLSCTAAGIPDPLLSPNSPSSQMGEFTLVGHSRVVRMLACSNDCSLLVSGSDDCTIKIWDTMSRQLLRTLMQSKGPISCLMVLPMPVVLAHPELQQMMPPAKNVMPLQRRGGAVAGKPAALPWVTLPPQGPADVNRFFHRLVSQKESLQKDCLSIQAMMRVALDMEQKGSVAALEMDTDRLREDVRRAINNAEGWRKSHKELFELYTTQIGENPPKPRRARGEQGANRSRGGVAGATKRGVHGGGGLLPPAVVAGASAGGAGGVVAVSGPGRQVPFGAREADTLLDTGAAMPPELRGMGLLGLGGQESGIAVSGALDVNFAGAGAGAELEVGLGDDQSIFSWKKGKAPLDMSFVGHEPNGMDDNFFFMHI